MRRAMWERLGLTEDEWEECRRSALEMSLATGARVPPRKVAVEFALARSFEGAIIEPRAPEIARASQARMPARAY